MLVLISHSLSLSETFDVVSLSLESGVLESESSGGNSSLVIEDYISDVLFSAHSIILTAF